jgi:hypothetical protein
MASNHDIPGQPTHRLSRDDKRRSNAGSSDRDIAGRQNTDVSRDHQQPSSDVLSKLADRNESGLQPPRDQAIADFFNLALDITMVRFL